MLWAGEVSVRVNSFSSSLAPTINYNSSYNANGNAHLSPIIKYPLLIFLLSYSDFLHGLSTPVPASPTAPRASERLRLVYSYVTATPSDGGLGIHPENDSWSRIESIMTLHDPEFNDSWIRSLTTSTATIGHGRLDAIRTQVMYASSPEYL